MNDGVLTEVYHRFANRHDCYLDGILCDPDLRRPFLQEIRRSAGEIEEADVLGRLISLRKRGQLARKKPR